MTLGGWLEGALLWHFAAIWVLAANGVITRNASIQAASPGRASPTPISS